MNELGLWALLWSHSQNALHIEPVSQWLSKNRQAYTANRGLTDYHPLHIGSRKDCETTANVVRNTLAQRDPLKGLLHDLPPIELLKDAA